ncbi:hypothetical protein COB11_01265, partial [Candidatus Aerophobetes bacterium]
WRADTLLTKEPETIAWLDRTVNADSVLFDVGANIGLYALYAAHLFPGKVRVCCFEPEPLNTARLNLNIARNNFSKQILAFPLGLGTSDGIGTFRISVLEAGRALHGDRMVAAGEEAHITGLALRSLDSLLSDSTILPKPTHLKIDVDGPELDILNGAQTALGDPTLKHLLVELETADVADVETMLKPMGFEITEKGEPVDDMVNVIFEKSSS